MTNIDDLAGDGCASAGRRAAPTRWLARQARRLAAALRDYVEGRSVVAGLGGLDSRMLKDIGLYRGDIDADALRRLARERSEMLDIGRLKQNGRDEPGHDGDLWESGAESDHPSRSLRYWQPAAVSQPDRGP